MRFKTIESDPNCRDGIPVIRDTRFPIALVLNLLARGDSLSTISRNYIQNAGRLRKALEELASYVDSVPFREQIAGSKAKPRNLGEKGR